MTHDDVVYSVAFSPDGKYVVSGSRDKTAWGWGMASRRFDFDIPVRLMPRNLSLARMRNCTLALMFPMR